MKIININNITNNSYQINNTISHNFRASELPSEDLDASTKLSRSFGMDIVFAIDLSSSSSKEILQKQKNLIRSLTEYLLPSSYNQLGLVTYSNKGHVNADLSSAFNVMVLDSIENTDKLQIVDSGIKVASDMIFKPRNRDEKLKNRSKVLVLFVTGKQSINNPPFVTKNYEKLLQDDNVRTLVIAFDESEDNFNKNLHGSNLLQYTQEEKTENSVKSYLMGLHENAEGRSFNTDVVFAMDLSSSSDDILKKQKKIVKALTEYLLPSKSNELGLITYSDIGNIDSELSPKFNYEILDKIENNGRRQNVSSAITVALENIFKKRYNNEKLKKKQRVLALFVVGKPSNHKKPSSSNPQAVPEPYGKLLEENNVLTVIIGFDEVGDDFNKNMPGSKLLKYSEDKTTNELKELMQGWHDIGINKNVTMPQRTNKYEAGLWVFIGVSLIIIVIGIFVGIYFFFKKHRGQGNEDQYEQDSGFVEQEVLLALRTSSDQDPVNRVSFLSV